MFYAYTGCDSVSSFSTKGKKTAWDTWRSYNEVTTTFLALSAGPDEVPNEDVAVLEQFTILLYDHTSDLITLMKLGSTFLPRRDEPWMPFLLPEQPLCSTLWGLYTKVGIAGGRHSKLLWIFLLQETVDGLTPITGNLTWGQHLIQGANTLWLQERGQCKCKRAALRCTALCQCGGDCNDN